jgi:hypothetical protein
MNIRGPIALFIVFSLFSCEKNPVLPEPEPVFEILVRNEFDALDAHFAVFISDPTTGTTKAFRWVPEHDTIRLQVPNSTSTAVFDCTVVKITTVNAPGTGIRDTLLALTTYTNLATLASINLRNTTFQRASSVRFSLTGMNTLDSIVVPDAYAITKPEASNNFTGEYWCYHTGQCWIRVLADGSPFWRFIRFNNINGETLEANTLNVNLLLPILAPPLQLNFPFVADWKYQVDGMVDTANLQFFPLSQPLRPPGTYVPFVDVADIFEPVNNDLFNPNRPYNGLRIQLQGTEAAVGGYTYRSDHFYSAMPSVLPIPNFDLAPTTLSDQRLFAVQCIGNFDLLAFSRTRSGYNIHQTIHWEVLTKPRVGILSYRLPDVPSPLAGVYPPLKNYAFNAGVLARAESYEKGLSYEEIIHQYLGAEDVLWQARAGYLGKERGL